MRSLPSCSKLVRYNTITIFFYDLTLLSYIINRRRRCHRRRRRRLRRLCRFKATVQARLAAPARRPDPTHPMAVGSMHRTPCNCTPVPLPLHAQRGGQYTKMCLSSISAQHFLLSAQQLQQTKVPSLGVLLQFCGIVACHNTGPPDR